MNKSYNEDTFCVAPWLSSHISTFNTVIPCCLFKVTGKFGETQKGRSFKQHYNSKNAIATRKALWTGDKIPECRECWFREESDSSYRMSLNNKFQDYIEEIVENTNDDFTLNDMKFRMLDLRFDNKCNLRCRMCSPAFSSALYKEHKELGHSLGVDWDNAYHVAVDDDEYKFIIDQLQYTKVLFFAGGEPLTQDKFYEILQHCIDNGFAKDISVWITSNCTKIKYKKYNLINMLKHFKDVEITASLDAYGDRAEYMRYPAKWDDVESNILTLINSVKNVNFIICPTIQVINVFHIFDLVKYFLNNEIVSASKFNFNILTHPPHLNVANLPQHMKNELTSKCDKMIEWLNEYGIKNNIPPASTIKDIAQFKLVKEMLKGERDESQMFKFLNYTETVDKYRGNDMYKAFPELTQLKDLVEVLP